jgi:beta-galactosidase
MLNKLLHIFLLVAVVTSMSKIDLFSSNQLFERKITNINGQWRYLENNAEKLSDISNANLWENINLPHTWNQWDAVDNAPGYRRDASWYEKEIFIPNYSNAQYILYFEGVNISSTIYLNNEKISSHIGGYVGFEIDITNYILKGENNKIHVRVDNSFNRDVIPSQKADFFIYGGIVRDVWLKIVPEVNLEKIKIQTPNISKESSETLISIDFHNESQIKNTFLIKCLLIEPQTSRVILETTVKAQDVIQDGFLNLPILTKPKLWSPDDPNLYELKIQLIDGDKILDETSEIFGYRWYDFEEYGAFYLNGERLLLRGTHRHEEHAGFGAAMPNELHEKDIIQMKELGVNFLRLGHYPQDPVIYEMCNKLGIIVWDELPWCRGGMGGEKWQKNTINLLKEQINQNFNHPCVFFWSLGNEIYWLPDFEGGDDTNRINKFLKKLNSVAHELDNTRMTAIRKYYDGSNLVDVFSPSIWSGWYSGTYTNYSKTIKENHQKYPRFLHMEYGGSSHIGRHTEHPITGDGVLNEDGWEEVANQVNIKNIAKSGDWSENYIVDLFDWYLGVTETNETFAGNAQWAFKDFGTPLRPENAIPYLNQKGLVDREGKPKDAYYVFKSYWSNDPFTYIESHTWTKRRGPRNIERNLSIFSNCEKVELIHNGNKLGKKVRNIEEFPACGLNWDVLFTEGKNTLIAIGFIEGMMKAQDTLVVNYEFQTGGKPDHISLSQRKLENGNYLIEAYLMDSKGNHVLDYEKHLYFSKDGNGELLVNYGTPTRSQVIEMANGYAAIELKPGTSGKAIIEARNQDFKGSYLEIDFEK